MSSPSTFAIWAALFAASPSAPQKPVAMRSRAREVLKASRCGACHDSSMNTDHAKALAVYDLANAEWPATMSDAQLPKLLSRLKSAPAADQQLIRDFIRAELRSRSAQHR